MDIKTVKLTAGKLFKKDKGMYGVRGLHISLYRVKMNASHQRMSRGLSSLRTGGRATQAGSLISRP